MRVPGNWAGNPDLKHSWIWRYIGLLPDEMANRIVLFSERTAQTTVNDVEHTESPPRISRSTRSVPAAASTA
jgi:hypothetical protein